MAGDREQQRADASDDTLWLASRSGDQLAFAALYERHANTIYNYLFRRLADWTEAEDSTAVVFLEAYRRRSDAVIVEGKLLPWLYGIATNVLSIGAARSGATAVYSRSWQASPVAELDLTHARVEAGERMRSVLNHIATLPRAQQDVIALCTWSGLSYEEAAVALGVPVGTVRSRLSRARASLVELERSPGHKQADMERGREER